MPRLSAVFGLMLLFAAAWAAPATALEWNGTTMEPTGANGDLGNGFFPTDVPYNPQGTILNSGQSVVIRDGSITGGTNPLVVEGNVYGGAGVTTTSLNPVDATGNSVSFLTDTPGNDVGVAPNISGSAPPWGTGSVFGGLSTHGNATGNRVTMQGSYGGTITGSVYGGHAGFREPSLLVTASNNTVTIEDGSTVSIGGSVTGGLSFGGDTLGNRVSMGGGSAASVQGGRNDGTGDASSNEVAITAGTTVVGITGAVHGGLAANGSASSNIVTIDDGTLGSVVGGQTNGIDGVAERNSVTIATGTVNGVVHGGLTAGGAAIYNTVAIYGGVLGNGVSAVYGGQSAGAGAATANTVTVANAALSGDAFGGWSRSGSANDNRVSIAASSAANVVGGYSGNGGDADDNTVTIQSSGVSGYVVGGQTATGTAGRNHVVITDSGAGSYVYGGYVSGFNAASAVAGNTVTYTGRTGTDTIGGTVAGGYTAGSGAVTDNGVSHQGGTITGDIYGGYGESGTISANTVDVGNDAAAGGSIHGGFNAGTGINNAGAVNGNRVGVSTSGTIGGAVIGGRTAASSGDVATNTVAFSGTGSVGTITIATYALSAVGGVAEGTGAIRANSAVISGGTLGGIAAGGMSFNSGAVSANGLQVSGGTIAGDAFGGFSSGAGDVSANTATVSGTANLQQNLYGGYATGGNATRNSVTVTAGTVTGLVAAGRSFTGNVNQNTLALGGGSVGGDVHGGLTESGTGSASANRVTLSGTDVTGSVSGGRSAGGSASDNSVTMTSGSAGDIYGGRTGGTGAASRAVNNTVTLTGPVGGITGPAVNGDVYGGFGGAGAVTTGNRVNVSGTIVFAGAASSIWGGSNNSDITGNILTTHGRDYNVGTIGNFETYNFTLSRDYVGETVYTINGPAVDVAGTTVNIVFNSGGSPLDEGDVITLFSDSTGALPVLGSAIVPNEALFDQEIELVRGASPLYTDSLDVVVRSTRAAKETQLLGQAQLSALAMLNFASDLHREVAGMIAASEACQADGVGENCEIYVDCNRPVVFAGVAGGSSSFDTGGNSEITVDHVSFLGGVGYRTGDTLLAAFFETGWGQFDAKLNSRAFNDNDSLDYTGGGLLARYERGGFYAEGSVHAGRSTTSFNTAVRLARVDYESKATYYGADAVLGYRFGFPCSTLDLSVRYGWNRSKGDTVMVGSNSVLLDSVDSHRVRAAGRWTAARTRVLNPFAGAGVEYEMDGKSSGRVYTYSLAQAAFDGFSFMGEVGLHVGNNASRYSADIGIEGYLGKREGLAAKAMFGWTF